MYVCIDEKILGEENTATWRGKNTNYRRKKFLPAEVILKVG